MNAFIWTTYEPHKFILLICLDCRPRFRAFSELEGKPANQWTRPQPVDCGECYAVHQRHWPSAWTPRRPLPQTCKWRIQGPLKLGLLHFHKSLTKFKVIKSQGMENQQLQYSQRKKAIMQVTLIYAPHVQSQMQGFWLDCVSRRFSSQ